MAKQEREPQNETEEIGIENIESYTIEQLEAHKSWLEQTLERQQKEKEDQLSRIEAGIEHTKKVQEQVEAELERRRKGEK